MQASMSINIQKRLADKHEVWVYAQVKKITYNKALRNAITCWSQ